MFSARATSDIVRTWETGGPEPWVPGNFFGYFLVCYKKVTRQNNNTLRMEFYSGSAWCKVSLSWGNDFVQRDPQWVCFA